MIISLKFCILLLSPRSPCAEQKLCLKPGLHHGDQFHGPGQKGTFTLSMQLSENSTGYSLKALQSFFSALMDATGISWSPLCGVKGVKPPMEFGDRTQDCSPGHAGKEGPQLARTGASQGFPRAAAPVGVFPRAQSCGHCGVFQICWHIECSTFTASSFRI